MSHSVTNATLSNNNDTTNQNNNTTPSNPYDIPLRRDVSAAIGFIGLLSFTGCCFMIYFILRARKHSKLDTRLVLYLSICDLVQGLAAILSFGWISTVPQTYHPLCTIQALMFEFGDCASAFSSAIIASLILGKIGSFDTLGTVTPGTKFEFCSVFLIFGVPILFVFCGYMREVSTHIPIWTPVGYHSWCWISEHYPVERLMLHYTWIFIIFFYLLLVYMYISCILYNSLSRAPNRSQLKKRKNLIYKMMGYPIIFALVFLPLGIQRLALAVNEMVKIPNEYVAFAICIFVSNGMWNALYYGYTRRIHSNPSSSETQNSKKATGK